MNRLAAPFYFILLMGLCLTGQVCVASSLVYTPVNPDFGGNPFNGSTLLSEASANNHFTANTTQQNSQQNFATTIQDAVLGEVSSQIAGDIYGANSQASGTITVGSTQYQWVTVAGQRQLTTTDLITGKQLVVTIPVTGLAR